MTTTGSTLAKFCLYSASKSQGECMLTQSPAFFLKVSGDKELLRIVYKNFIDNAVKYGREGGTIRLGFMKSAENYAFEVWNDGDGLVPDKLAQLFGKFVRLHRDKDTTRSTGLGLFITKDIIEKHGGSVRAESREGEWISFTFTLPIPLSEAT